LSFSSKSAIFVISKAHAEIMAVSLATVSAEPALEEKQSEHAEVRAARGRVQHRCMPFRTFVWIAVVLLVKWKRQER
jgi:hypothetical protein